MPNEPIKTVAEYIEMLKKMPQDAVPLSMNSSEEWDSCYGAEVQKMHDCDGYYQYCAGEKCGLCRKFPIVDTVHLA